MTTSQQQEIEAGAEAIVDLVEQQLSGHLVYLSRARSLVAAVRGKAKAMHSIESNGQCPGERWAALRVRLADAERRLCRVIEGVNLEALP